MAFRLMHSVKEAFEMRQQNIKLVYGSRSVSFFCKLIVFETLEYRSKFVRASEANRIST